MVEKIIYSKRAVSRNSTVLNPAIYALFNSFMSACSDEIDAMEGGGDGIFMC